MVLQRKIMCKERFEDGGLFYYMRHKNSFRMAAYIRGLEL